MEIQPALYHEVVSLRRAGKKLGADISEGKRPLLWLKMVDNETLIGCIGAYVQGKKARLRGWLILPRYQGRGYGRQLFEAMLEVLKLYGIEQVEMNTRHIEFGHKMGFKSTGVKYSGSTWFKGHGEKMARDL